MHVNRYHISFLFILFIVFSCQYENAENLYYTEPDNHPIDTTDNDTDSLTISRKLLLDIPFNGTIEDESEQHLTIIPWGSPELTFDRFDDENKALYLNGENQYIELELGEQDSISVSFWFNCGSGRSCYSSLFDYGVNAVKTNIDGYSGPTSFYITSFYNNLDELNADYYFRYYEWYHIYVSACNNPVIYVNGEKAGDIHKNIVLNLTTSNLIIGKSVMENSDEEVYFNGVIDDIKIYNYALSNQEINALYTKKNLSVNLQNHEVKY